MSGENTQQNNTEPTEAPSLEQQIGALGDDIKSHFYNDEGSFEFDPNSLPSNVTDFLPSDILKQLETFGQKPIEGDGDEIIVPKENGDEEIIAWEGFDDFGIPKSQFDKLSPEIQEKLDNHFAGLKEASKFVNPKFREAFQAFSEDPFVQARIAHKNGEFSNEVIQKSIQIENNPAFKNILSSLDEGQSRQLVQLMREQLSGAIQLGEIKSEEGYKVRSRVTDEINKITNLDDSLKTTKSIDDPEHPLADFFKWYLENNKNINMLNIGGPETYSLYLQKTGKMNSALQTAEKRGAGNATRILRNASRNAVTMPSGKGNETPNQNLNLNQYGVDINRFKSDYAYQSSVFDKFGHDPKMRGLMEQWALG